MFRARLTVVLPLAIIGVGAALLAPLDVTARVAPAADQQATATPECEPDPVGPHLDLALHPSTARPRQPVTVSVDTWRFGIDSLLVTVSRPGQQAIQLSWRGSRTGGVDIPFAAPDEAGEWLATATASGEFIVCSNGHWLYAQGGASTRQPVTLTVAGSIVFLPLALDGYWSASPTVVPPSPTPDGQRATATTTLPPSAPPGTPATRTPTPEWAATQTATSELMPTAPLTPTVTATEPPESRYFLTERWQNNERGPGCPGLMVDFPMYFFDPDTGVLETWAQPHLEPADIGYFGLGVSITGMGSGAGSSLSRIQKLPHDASDVRLLSISADGAATFVREHEEIELAPGGEKRWQWTSRPEGPGCVVTTTLRVTNFGYQDRSKIVYR